MAQYEPQDCSEFARLRLHQERHCPLIGKPDHKMLGRPRITPQDCLGSARLPSRTERVWWHLTGAAMDHATIEPAIRILLTEIHSRLAEAARIAKAAEACALAGS